MAGATPMSRALLLTVNVHGVGPEAASQPEADLFGRDAHGKYTYRIGLERLLDALRAFGLPATLFWPSGEAQRMPALFERCLRDGHEVASHGRAFEDHATLGAAEDAVIEEAHHELTRLAGSGAPRVPFADGNLVGAHDPDIATPRLPLRFQFPRRRRTLFARWGWRAGNDRAAGLGSPDRRHSFPPPRHPGPGGGADERGARALLAVDGYACLTFHPRADIGIGRAARLPMLKRLSDLAAGHGALPMRGAALAERMLTVILPN
jgi:peptidoglycan/xylan/chitin deacetylase (PgdA/CDA1 family)